jgi:glycosyltransferase involved in cell wall biosynthesis
LSLKNKAHVIIPTHSAHDTLEYAVLSALNQTLLPYRVTIIGDGVTEKVRALSQELVLKFSNVEFLDNPKLRNRGEKYRDSVIRASDADFITYLCDDDLYMPNHLEIMAKHLETFDFVHPRPTFVRPRGSISFLPSGIESQEIRTMHGLQPRWNTISLTGASHTRDSYLSLEEGWAAGPPEVWTDLYMWVKFLGNRELSTFTSPLTTTIKLMYQKEERELLNRGEIIQRWYQVTVIPEKLELLQRRIETRFTVFQFLWLIMVPLWKLKFRYKSNNNN